MKNLFLVVFLILLTSCGMDTNGGSSTDSIVNDARGIAGQNCTALKTYHFAGQAYNQSSITVQSNSTGGAGGSVDQYFVGTNSFGDVLVVSKMSTGQFDVALSLCAVNALGPDSVLTSVTTLVYPNNPEYNIHRPISLGIDNSNRTGSAIVVDMHICANIYYHNNYYYNNGNNNTYQSQSCSKRSFYPVTNSNYYPYYLN